MFLQILRSLERLATKLALVGLEGHVNANMRRNVITLHSISATVRPTTLQLQIPVALAADMEITQVGLASLSANAIDNEDVILKSPNRADGPT